MQLQIAAIDRIAHQAKLLDEAEELLNNDTQPSLLAVEHSHFTASCSGRSIPQVRSVEGENATLRCVAMQAASEYPVKQS